MRTATPLNLFYSFNTKKRASDRPLLHLFSFCYIVVAVHSVGASRNRKAAFSGVTGV